MALSIDEFVKEEQKRLEQFHQWWLKNNKENPDYFPLELPDDNTGVFFESYIDFNENYLES